MFKTNDAHDLCCDVFFIKKEKAKIVCSVLETTKWQLSIKGIHLYDTKRHVNRKPTRIRKLSGNAAVISKRICDKYLPKVLPKGQLQS